MVIISASGMAEAGRILHHLKNNIEDERNTIVIVSWQAPNTRGRQLAEQEKEIKIFGEKFIRRLKWPQSAGFPRMPGRIFCWNMPRRCRRHLNKSSWCTARNRQLNR